MLVSGIAIGIGGTIIGLPMDIIGVCGLGNIVALTAFCIGLILNGYWPTWFGFSLGDYYVPQGFMVGAGLVAMVQSGLLIARKYKEKKEKKLKEATAMPEDKVEEAVEELAEEIETESRQDKGTKPYVYTRTAEDMSKALARGAILYIIGAVIMALIGGLYAEMSIGRLIIWVIFAMIAALVSEILVGISAMHSGYFPAMATVVIFLVIAMFIGFPPRSAGVSGRLRSLYRTGIC